MNLNHYQAEARAFAVYPEKGDNIVYPVLGLAGEAGEVANQAKKVLRDDNGVVSDSRREAMIDELGDVLWYVANSASELNIDLQFLAELNLDKLSARRANDAIHGDKRKSTFSLSAEELRLIPDDDIDERTGH